jgi:hypothetical protein
VAVVEVRHREKSEDGSEGGQSIRCRRLVEESEELVCCGCGRKVVY